jgi:heme/copper-type cytochrome/quinol oxidase subunit 1
MLMQAFVIVLTSLLTSVLTLTAAWFVFDRYLKTRMWDEVDAGGIDMLEESLNLWFRGGRPKD